jgi:hypothetical protein
MEAPDRFCRSGEKNGFTLPFKLNENIWVNRTILFIFFCEKENEPKEIAPRDVALTGCPCASRIGRSLWNVA